MLRQFHQLVETVVGGTNRRKAQQRNRRLVVEPLNSRALLATLTVDALDPDCAVVNDDTYCHLREAIDAASVNDTIDVRANGTHGTAGPPLGPPVRTSVGDSCLVDISFPYTFSGTLEASGTLDYRILSHGPCGNPPYSFDEEWISLGDFMGSLDGVQGSFGAILTAEVREQVITGQFVFGTGSNGLKSVQGTVDVINDTTDNLPGTYSGIISFTVVPESSTCLISTAGAAGMIMLRSCRRKKSEAACSMESGRITGRPFVRTGA